MIEGIIQKLLAGFYYVKTDDGLIECRARGIFRKRNLSPLVGDRVKITIDPLDETKGVVEHVFPRKVEMARPSVANVDQAIIVFALKHPNPNLNLLDKLLVLCEYTGLEVVLCFNKNDLDDDHIFESYYDIYRNANYKIVKTSTVILNGIEELKGLLKDKISVFAGPSGVGKSSLLNVIMPGLQLQTGELSEKIHRGKHTTRHTELVELPSGGFVVDTPGFTSLNIDFINAEELSEYFPEIYEHSEFCRFSDCSHMNEPGCRVIEELDKGNIHFSRYNSYKYFVNHLKKDRRKRRYD